MANHGTTPRGTAGRNRAGSRWGRGTPKRHAGEGIEDGTNVAGLTLLGLSIVALALALVSAGYGFGGWAVVGGVACAVLFIAGAVLLFLEWRRRHRGRNADPEIRQGH
ncbi:hypothetical protein LTV02_12680 [Nocardia yamanashiensis]|uniref:hypothetical protein n=1 Tax=Nocardia yamanashiensis TaxID=209247 RepID=UPI001E430F3E|nr:hypothetical protein [Nocardia yamanashiensis]UGT44187.1 hypothetical protein LTV02_12680 [Nocardia yamanashiensis]